jgi:hypothetical protein
VRFSLILVLWHLARLKPGAPCLMGGAAMLHEGRRQITLRSGVN